MNLLGNLIWLLFGGIIIALEYMAASFILFITIIGIPFGIQTLKLAALALWPFGKEVINVESDAGCLNVLMNVIWLLFGGIWIAVSHLLFGALLAVTIIGIPFAMQHFKLAAVAISPFGKDITIIDEKKFL
ncbi:MAG: YccF domain-containing protein [Chlorobi bacterium]|nr:YccF domain-containing protein [Chlorobiota bacterium]